MLLIFVDTFVTILRILFGFSQIMKHFFKPRMGTVSVFVHFVNLFLKLFQSCKRKKKLGEVYFIL